MDHRWYKFENIM